MHFILIFALFLRLALISLPAFSVDMNSFIAWAEHMVAAGPVDFYATIWSDYAPGYLYVLWFLGWVHKIIPVIPYEILLKAPAVLADLATGFLIYKIARYTIYPSAFLRLGSGQALRAGDIRHTKALALASLYLFNPAIIFNSTVWGQVDSVSTALVIAAVATMTSRIRNQESRIQNRNQLIGFFLLGLATIVKPQSMIFLPLFVLYALKGKWKKEVSSIKYLVVSIINNTIAFALPVFLLSLPFFVDNPIFGLVKHLGSSAVTYPYTSVFAMNFWGIFGTWQSDVGLFVGISYKLWGLILFSILYIGISIWGIRNKMSSFLLLMPLIAISFFMLPTRIHERYLHPFFALLLMTGGYGVRYSKRYLFIGLYTALSVLYFLNLYYVYGYYNKNIIVYDEMIAWVGEHFSEFSFIAVGAYVALMFLIVHSKFQNPCLAGRQAKSRSTLKS